MISKVISFIIYYILLLLGFFIISVLFWSRFIRERTIRNIPDILFNEYRFWILLYICCIYLYIIRSLLKPKESSLIVKEILELIYKPLIILDHAIKYNKYIKPYYYKFMDYFINLLLNTSDKQKIIIIFFMQIFPRMILVTFLLLDTFYFHKLELFYKVVFIGIVPFLYRYIKYSIKDMKEYYISKLNEKYESVYMVNETQADPNINVKFLMQNESVAKDISIKEYMKILTDIKLNKNNYSDYVFEGICRDEIYEQYAKKIYGYVEHNLTLEDYKNLKNDFENLMSKIVNCNIFLILYMNIEEIKFIKWFKIIIFSLYFIAWSYILCISYYYYPNDFYGFMYFIFNYSRYLIRYTDIFNEHEEILNQNYFILKVIKYLYKKLLKRLIDEI